MWDTSETRVFEEEESLPPIPEDIFPYFRESAAAAVESYGGFVPPSYDRAKYSPLADEKRMAAKKKAKEEHSRLTGVLFDKTSSAIRLLQKEGIVKQLALIQGGGASGEAPREEQALSQNSASPLLWPVQKYYLSAHAVSGEGARENSAGDAFTGEASQAMPEAEDARKSLPQDAPDREEYDGENPDGADSNREGETRGENASDVAGESREENASDEAGESREENASDAAGESREDDISEEEAAPAPSRRTIFVGDSRTVGMHMHVPDRENEYWFARDSMGYSWMVNTGVPAVEDLIGEDTDVVILMGVNDLRNAGSYVEYMNRKGAEWKERGARTFFVSVTPVVDSKSRYAKNSGIEAFNSYAQENLRNVSYIDAYSRIRDSFGSPDGIHFDGATYQEIYRIIRFYLYRGWYREAGLTFYFDCGRPVTGWNLLDGKWQYMDGCGVRWIRDSRVGDVCFSPYPETGLLDPYDAVLESRALNEALRISAD